MELIVKFSSSNKPTHFFISGKDKIEETSSEGIFIIDCLDKRKYGVNLNNADWWYYKKDKENENESDTDC